MKKMFPVQLALILLFTGFFAGAQKTIVVLGSSTAFGTGASPSDSSWVNRLQAAYRQNTGDGIDTNIVNLAVPGTNTYKAMPTGYIPPPLRDQPDPNMNITKALTYNPHIIIVNFPSNAPSLRSMAVKLRIFAWMKACRYMAETAFRLNTIFRGPTATAGLTASMRAPMRSTGY